MTIEAEVAALTVATTALLSTVNVKKDTLDGYIVAASASAVTANTHAVTSTAQAVAAAASAGAAGNSANASATSAVQAANSAATAQAIVGFDPATKANLASPTFTGTVGGISKGMVGLPNVDDVSDANKPVSTAQATAINAREINTNKDTSGGYPGLTQFKLNLRNAANTFTNFFTSASTAARTWTLPDRSGTLADNTDLALKAPISNPTFTGAVGGITKAMVGLGSADDTSDANKPISSATSTALALKAPLANPTFTGNVGGITPAMLGAQAIGNNVFGAATFVEAENSMGVTRSIAVNGYRKTGDGLIEQWGSSVLSTNGASAVPVNFTIPFPWACASLNATNGDTGATIASVSSQLSSLSGFAATFVVGASGIGSGVTVRVNWKATGY